ncbi:hypothetical protein [Paenarthrobacter nitroguajacolicus]|uniref:hypothetical protein n=1 Tax=Paenarthrobacter nitroguajacolicus TaxID=211146 RepID=UPI003AF3839E
MRGVDREDLYQLHAYSSTFEASIAARAYPATSADLPMDERNTPWQTSNRTLSFLTLPTEKDRCVPKLAQWLGNSDALR